MTLKLNPFSVVTHNEWTLPRIAFHATHILIGLVVLMIGHLVGAPLWLIATVAVALAIYSKFVWLDWHRTSGTFFHPWVAYAFKPFDFVSDLGLTLLGVFFPAPLIFAGAYYVLSLVNDP